VICRRPRTGRNWRLHDPLTGLPNRVLLLDRLGHSLARRVQRGGKVDLLYLGVDDFKTINDSAGRSAGDQVLAALAPVLGHAVQLGGGRRGPGGLLARLGGDEFAILLDDGDPGQLSDAIHELLRHPLRLPDDQVFLSVSIGNAQVGPQREDATPEVVVTEANIAMHEAKRAGKARSVSFEPRMHEAARRRHRLGHELHEALAAGQFVVHYMPVVELSSGMVTGAEALVRWQHPTRGLVGPDSFISRAEETGLIVPLGAWVLEQACRVAVGWQALAGRPLTVAVNVSGRQLREPGFVDAVRSVLRDSGLAPELLCLEMTESILMERDEAALGMLTTLRGDGVHLAIDDFGTGYSSLAALQRLPVDQLKIDRSFVGGLPEDENAATIAWAIVHLGHALDLGVLAEGVETPAQRAELLRFGCDQGQGYLFGAGCPPEEMAELVARPARQVPVLPWPRGADPAAFRT
jgi:diguanylate cyclase (GGDEF)-like protein